MYVCLWCVCVCVCVCVCYSLYVYMFVSVCVCVMCLCERVFEGLCGPVCSKNKGSPSWIRLLSPS